MGELTLVGELTTMGECTLVGELTTVGEYLEQKLIFKSVSECLE